MTKFVVIDCFMRPHVIVSLKFSVGAHCHDYFDWMDLHH